MELLQEKKIDKIFCFCKQVVNTESVIHRCSSK